MKKMLLFLLLAAMLGCRGTDKEGAENACQFVLTIYRIEDMDSCTAILKKAEEDAELGIIKYSKLNEIAENIESTLPKYTTPAYTVTITQKSTKKDVVRVIMNQNGITPYILYDGYIRHYDEFIGRLANDCAVIDTPEE